MPADSRQSQTAPTALSPLNEALASSPSTQPDSALRFQLPQRVGQGEKFHIKEGIGHGGMGTVFRATDLKLQRDVAIKFLLPSNTLSSGEILALCYREARAIARMDHENIVRVYEMDDQRQPPFIVMEYLRGGSLQDRLRQGRLTDPEVMRVMLQVAKGVGHAHKLGVLHRDLKPSNVFMLMDGSIKLLDFGLARLNAAAPVVAPRPEELASEPTLMTLSQAGTAAYMAPEQWRGTELDERTDMWSAMVMLFQLLTGSLPYPSEDLLTLYDQVMSAEPPPSLHHRRADLPREFVAWFERCFSKDPQARCQNAEELATGLALLDKKPMAGWGSQPSGGIAAQYSEFFTEQVGPSTRLHRAERRSGRVYWQKALLLFIEDEKTADAYRWGELPAALLRSCNIDVDTALHTINPDPANGEWSAYEASLLAELLEGELKRYRHIFIVARSSGYLTVQRMFVAGLAAMAGGEKGMRPLDARLYLYRVRQLIRVTETAASSGFFPVNGVDQVTLGLDAEIERTEREFRRWAQYLQTADLPHLACQQVTYQARSATGSRHAEPVHDALVVLLPRLGTLLTSPEAVITRELIAQAFELDCMGNIHLLVEARQNDVEKAVPTIPRARGAAQAETLRTLLQLAQQSHQRPPCLVVTGDAGVGKSTVLRRLTRRLSSDYLDRQGGDVPVPIFIPLYFTTVDSESLRTLERASGREKGEVLLKLLLSWWCEWFSGITAQGELRTEWLIERLRSEPTLLMLDGIDEFLTNNPAIGPADLRLMLQLLRQSYAPNQRLCIVLGVRSSQPSLMSLVSDSSHLFEVLRLTVAQADTYFPAAREWFTGVADAQVKRLLLTPLLLAHLDSHGARPALTQATTRAEVLEHVLLTIIEKSGLSQLASAEHELADPAHWVMALMLVAWRMFIRLRGDIEVNRLPDAAQETIVAWGRHLAVGGNLDPASYLLSSFALLRDPQMLDALLRRTVLYPTGDDEVRFIHREWQDFLTAKYCAESIRWKYVDELGHFALTLPIFLAVGEMLGSLRIEEDLVREVEERTAVRGEELIHANFCAVLGNSQTPMSEPAMQRLLGSLDRVSLLSRLVTLASFGNRVMRNSPTDVAVADVRKQLVRGLIALTTNEHVDRLSRSLAWCNIVAFHKTFGTEPPPIPWPGLGEDPADEEPVLHLLSDQSKSPPQVTPRQRSLQLAWVQIQTMILVAPHRPISAAHYLYTIVVCKRHRVHIPEVTQDLPALFADSSPICQGFMNYALVPELQTLFLRCREIFYAP